MFDMPSTHAVTFPRCNKMLNYNDLLKVETGGERKRKRKDGAQNGEEEVGGTLLKERRRWRFRYESLRTAVGFPEVTESVSLRGGKWTLEIMLSLIGETRDRGNNVMKGNEKNETRVFLPIHSVSTDTENRTWRAINVDGWLCDAIHGETYLFFEVECLLMYLEFPLYRPACPILEILDGYSVSRIS